MKIENIAIKNLQKIEKVLEKEKMLCDFIKIHPKSTFFLIIKIFV